MQQKNIPAAQGGADLGSGSVGRLLFKLAVPAIVAQVINVLYNMVDRMYIGHLPEIGETAEETVAVVTTEEPPPVEGRLVVPEVPDPMEPLPENAILIMIGANDILQKFDARKGKR